MTIETISSDERDVQLMNLKNAISELIKTGINDVRERDPNAARQLEIGLVSETVRLEMTLTYPVVELNVFVSKIDDDDQKVWLFGVSEEIKQPLIN